MEERLVGTELKWFYLVGREQHGPVSESELRMLLADGTLDQGSKVWSKLLAGWMSVAEVALLARPEGKRPSTKPLAPVALRFVGGPRAGETIKLADQMHLGRSSSNDVALDSSTVSGQHALISRQGASYLLQDLGSTNGTWVNGVRIESETGISIGDAIHIGSTMIEVLGAGETGPEQSFSTPPFAVPESPSPPPVPPPPDLEPSVEPPAPAQPPAAESVPVPVAPPEALSPPTPVAFSQPPEPSSSLPEAVESDFGDKLLDTSVELRERVVEQPQLELKEQSPVEVEEQPPVEVEEQPPVEAKEQSPVEAKEQPPVEVEEQPPVEVEEQPPVEVDEQPPVEVDEQTSAQRGRRHHPGVAVAAAILIPGAGQAYNGQVAKGWLLLLGSLLVVPWIYSIFDALRTARRIVAEGGRRGRGGPFWIVLQGWFGLNLILLAVIILTVSGVTR
jgi:hypothetical protein